ncbi:hypothetical protein T484DRAFT_1985776 [Baffinella frigidus]|nr:hypothetical protein T484DRAFT_1985776 [Cryptophyta sp. CCMP2293]
MSALALHALGKKEGRRGGGVSSLSTWSESLPPSTSEHVRIPKGKGRRGEGMRTAERQSGQSCAADFYERRSEVDSEMLASRAGHRLRSLSECAFFMEEEDAVCEEAGAAMCKRSLSEGDISGDNRTSRSLHNVTTPAFFQRCSQNKKATCEHDEGWWTGGRDINPFLHTPAHPRTPAVHPERAAIESPDRDGRNLDHDQDAVSSTPSSSPRSPNSL